MKNSVVRGMAVLFLILCGVSATQASEFRGLWVDAFHPGFKDAEEVAEMVSAAKDANFNALIVQVRKRGDTYYQSKIEPRAKDIAADFDPLAQVIAKAHEEGIEVHAWLAVYDVSHEIYTDPPTHVCRQHPEWLNASRDGKKAFRAGVICLDPGIPEVRDHITSLVAEILEKYEVDGIFLDNPCYPDSTSGYNAISVELFNKECDREGIPASNDALWREWRMQQVTNLIKQVSSTISAAKPKAKFLVSVASHNCRATRNVYLQPWDEWTRQGLVDAVIPMLFVPADVLRKVSETALTTASERDVYIGIGGYCISPQLAVKQINDARMAGARGVCVFSYHYLGSNSKGTSCVKMNDLTTSVFNESAETPTLAWKE